MQLLHTYRRVRDRVKWEKREERTRWLMKKAMSDQSDNCIKVQLGDAMSFWGDEKQGFDNIEGDSQKQHKLNETLQVQRFISCHCFLVIIASLLASLKLVGWGVSRLSQVSTFQDMWCFFPPTVHVQVWGIWHSTTRMWSFHRNWKCTERWLGKVLTWKHEDLSLNVRNLHKSQML